MGAQRHIETLNDLFAALFKPAEGAGPVIRQPQRPLREDLFALFFPDALVKQYADKSKSNLTWFFNNDPRNKSVRRSLAQLLASDLRGTAEDVHRKCHRALWPRQGHAVFDAAALKDVLEAVSLPAALEGRLHILRGEGGAPSRLEVFFAVDEAAALSRLMLTLAVAGDVPAETVATLWRGDTAGDCDFLREDTSSEGSIRYARLLDLQGRHERAFEAFERVAGQLNRPAQTVDESMLYVRLGEMRFTGEGCLRDEREALRYDELGLFDGNPKSYYQLGRHATGSPARQAMEKAVELGYGPAIRELGAAWYNGSARLATLRNLESARRCYQRGLGMPGPDGAHCAFMLGQIYEAQGERAAAVSAYRVAQEGGSGEAAERLSRLDWMLASEATPAAEKPAAPGEKRYCLMNAPTGFGGAFLDGLTGRWDVTICGEAVANAPRGARFSPLSPDRALRELAQGVYWGGAPQFPELVIALLSADWRQNLRDAVALLGELQKLARSLGDRAWDLVDAVELYVLAEHDYGQLLLDAAFAGMGELYFRLRLCDPALDAADALFAQAPLFLPRLRAASDAPVNLVIVGGGDAAMAVLRRAMTLPMPEGATFTIDLWSEGADAVASRFRQLCPGMDGAAELCAAAPRFHDCAYDALPGAEGFRAGNYYVIATGDDARNLTLAARLRGALLRQDPEAERSPFIAVHVPRPLEGWLAGSLSAGPEGGREAGWCSQYELFPFGMATMYAPAVLRDDPLERRARQAHMLFIGLPNTRDARHTALGSYYRRQFNRDVARAEAQCLPYRLHQAGIDLPGWRLYGAGDEEARLAERYARWLKEEDHLAQAIRDEHSRRNRVKLALGWCPATPEAVAAYVRRGNPGHILWPARLDPFICPWEALESGELLRSLRDAVRSRFPEKSVPDPRRDEEASVRDTAALLGEV